MSSSGLGDFVYGPNPFDPGKENFQIVLGLDQESDVVVNIYSVAGEKIWSHDGTYTGNTKILWDGHNKYGELVANGAYLCFMKIMPRSGGSAERKKFTIAVLK
jgi:flagellar hook assembly protein FlgD